MYLYHVLFTLINILEPYARLAVPFILSFSSSASFVLFFVLWGWIDTVCIYFERVWWRVSSLPSSPVGSSHLKKFLFICLLIRYSKNIFSCRADP
jgi:hypothetical protein